MNVLLLSTSAAGHQWLGAALATFADEPEINRCDSADHALRVLQIHDAVHLVVVDADLIPCEVAPGIKALWRACRGAVLVAIASVPSQAEMVSCVNAWALGCVPRSLHSKDLGQVLAHVAGGSLWVPICDRWQGEALTVRLASPRCP